MCVAAFHVLLGLSADLSEYFGSGPQISRMLRDHDPMIYLLILLMVAMFAIAGLYGLSGAGRFRRLTLLRSALLLCGAVYTLRGIALIPEMLGTLGVTNFQTSPQNLLSSAVSLATGVCFLVGAAGLLLRSRRPQATTR